MRKLILTFMVLTFMFLMVSGSVGAGSNQTGYVKHEPVLHKVSEVRYVANRAWKQAHGPTKAQQARYERALAHPVPDTRGQMKIVWNQKKDKYEPLRAQLLRKDACGYHNVRPCILYAAVKYNQDYGYALSVASCESTLNPYASNGTHFGLFQFDSGTWAGSPYDDNGSVYHPLWNSLAAMWYWHNGEYSRWVCA